MFRRRAVSDAVPDLAVFGCIPRDTALGIPSRHLGLVTVDDNALSSPYLDRLVDVAELHLDLDALAALEAAPVAPLPSAAVLSASPARPVRICVARDAAFCFLYEDNLRLLREAGADLAFFSPLDDRSLPADPAVAAPYWP